MAAHRTRMVAVLAGAVALLATAAPAAGAAEKVRTSWWKIVGVSGSVAVDGTTVAPETCTVRDLGDGTQVLSGSYRTSFRSTRVISREPAFGLELGTGVPRTRVEPRVALRLSRNTSELYRTLDESGEACVERDASCNETSTRNARTILSAIPNTRGRPASRVLVSMVFGWDQDWLGGCEPDGSPGPFPGSIDDPFVSRRLVSTYVPARVFRRRTQTIRIRRQFEYSEDGVSGTLTLRGTIKLRRMKRTCTISGQRARCRDRRA